MDLAKELPPRGARGISLGDTFSPEKYASSHIFVLVNILGSFDSLGHNSGWSCFPFIMWSEEIAFPSSLSRIIRPRLDKYWDTNAIIFICWKMLHKVFNFMGIKKTICLYLYIRSDYNCFFSQALRSLIFEFEYQMRIILACVLCE